MSRHESKSQPKGTKSLGRVITHHSIRLAVIDEMDIAENRLNVILLKFRYDLFYHVTACKVIIRIQHAHTPPVAMATPLLMAS